MIGEVRKVKRWVFFIYGVLCHLLFLGTFAYMAGFVGDFLVPKSIDSPSNAAPLTAILINLALLGLFALQHSVMARPAFKRLWTRLVPTPIERSTYVLVSCLVTFFVMWQWRAMPTVVWDFQNTGIRNFMWVLFAVGWLLIPAVSLLIDHFDLFGTRQVWLFLKQRRYESLPFRVPLFYKHVRHPLYIGWTIAFWATPTMTVGHLLFASLLTGYMLLAAMIEELDLIAHFGPKYETYRKQVPMFVPRLSPVSSKVFDLVPDEGAKPQ